MAQLLELLVSERGYSYEKAKTCWPGYWFTAQQAWNNSNKQFIRLTLKGILSLVLCITHPRKSPLIIKKLIRDKSASS